jgi:protein-tyrosine phosphatase
MFSIFKTKSKLVTDLNWLGVDIHSHLLPAIDDGAKSLEESILYIKRLSSLGFTKLICTPHIFTEIYPNTKDTILPALENVRKSILLDNVEIEIDAAAEYMIDDSFNAKVNHMCLPGNHLLIEMSYLTEPPNIEQVIFELQVNGYIVILAHPERYLFYHRNLPRYTRFKELGCLFQLNLLSPVGYYGKEVARAANYLLNNRMYDLAGTDVHHSNHLKSLERSVQSGELYKKIQGQNFQNESLFKIQ